MPCHFFIVSFLTVASAAGDYQAPVVHPAPTLPAGWSPANDAILDDEIVTLRFSLSEQNIEEVRKAARLVSDPRSNTYGKYMTAHDVRELTKPKDADKAILQQWLNVKNVDYTTIGSNGFEARILVGQAKTLLQTDFYRAANVKTNQKVVRAGSYSLPAEVDGVVAAVYGLHGLPLPPRMLLPPAGVNVTPDILAQTYNVTGVTASGSTKNRQAVAEFQGQTMKASDLEAFFESYVAGSSASSIHKFVGDNGLGTAGVEASLDVDYIMGPAPGILTEFWYWANHDFCADLVNWTDTILSSEDPPLVFSVSYGWQGELSAVGCDQAKVDDIDANFAKLAARGISLIISSGDSGSGYDEPDQCIDQSLRMNDTVVDEGTLVQTHVGFNGFFCCTFAEAIDNSSWVLLPKNGTSPQTCLIYSSVSSTKTLSGAHAGGKSFPAPTPQQVVIYPSWPASSPWVTAVGATRFVGNKVGNPEMATDQFGSGGGFSSMFTAFGDQVDAVQHYLKTVNASMLPPAYSFPAGGRATPDVSALGEGFQVIANGKVESVGGTSASAPAFAGFVSLLNEARLKAGKPAMGFLNPFLYQNAAAFRDVTAGTNAVDRSGMALDYGFPCAPGWDPATGLGTPNFAKLLTLAMSVAPVEDTIVV